MLRTVLSLFFVVALIYVFAKVGLQRFGRFKGVTGGHMRVIERLSLDQRNALFLVEVDGKQMLLAGGGDKGVRLVAHLDEKVAKKGGADFAAALAKAEGAGGRDTEETPKRDEVS
jgi:flagellar biogenesis protein FliO